MSQLYIQQITGVDGTLDCFRFGVSSSVNGLVIGATVMEGFYVVFDRSQRRLGFALSSCAGKSLGPVGRQSANRIKLTTPPSISLSLL